MDWLDFLAVQGTLKGLLQHHSSKASNLQYSSFFHSSTLAWDGGAWQAAVHGVTKSRTRLSDFDFHSFRIDWLDLLAVQGTLKSLL